MRSYAIERLEERTPLSAAPFGAMDHDTGEFLLGDVLVSLVLMESNEQTSSINDNSETWRSATIEAVKSKVEEGLSWWEETLAEITDKHELNFVLDSTYADNPVSTRYEPITRPSTDFQFWIYDFLDDEAGIGHGGSFSTDIRDFNHAQRESHGTDWAFTIFVVNDENDEDGLFAPGGFDKAFAFSGGRFFVSPAGRPASTFAHETGHMFWARDEYPGGGTYNSFRGYYNTQNTNAHDNPTPGFVQEPSIMDSGNCEDGGGRLCTAWQNHTSSESSLEMIGWRDSDRDGVFDLADVPHTLHGFGYFDASSGNYRFQGESSVSTLPNRNSSGLQNDITLNKISRAQYRLDGGAWQTAAVYGTPTASLDLTIPLPEEATTIDIRTVDDVTGVSSPIFHGTIAHPTSTLKPGISGFVWDDANSNGRWDADERGLEGKTVQLVDAQGEALQLRQQLEPNDFPDSNTLLNDVQPGVELTPLGSQISDSSITSIASASADGNRVFAGFSSTCGGFCREWTSNSRTLRADFSQPVTTISLNAIGASAPGYGRLEVFDANDRLLDRYTTGKLAEGEMETMTLSRPTAEIAYAVAKAHVHTTIQLDRLQFGPEATAVTDANGLYVLDYLEPNDYTVELLTTIGQEPTQPDFGQQTVSLAEGEAEGEVNFGISTGSSPWQNPQSRFDVNADRTVAPIDALHIINDLNNNGSRALTSEATPPFLDVDGDRFIAPGDVLAVVNELNRVGAASGASEGEESRGSTAPMAGAAASLEGEGEIAGPSLIVGPWSSDGQIPVPSQDAILPLQTKNDQSPRTAPSAESGDLGERQSVGESATQEAPHFYAPSNGERHDVRDHVWQDFYRDELNGNGPGGLEDDLLEELAANLLVRPPATTK